MEIKRRLGKIQKALSPQVESMNVATEMLRMCDRFDELVAYAQEKIDRSAERKETLGRKAKEEQEAAKKAAEAAQNREAEENLADQQEASDKRNKAVSEPDAGSKPSKAE